MCSGIEIKETVHCPNVIASMRLRLVKHVCISGL